MADYQEAFVAKFRIVENQNKSSERSPSHTAIFNFTREEAIKAAQWFMQMAERVDTDGTTFSMWDYEKKEAYEVPGFSMYASLWGKSGKLSPPKPTTVSDGSASNQDLPF